MKIAKRTGQRKSKLVAESMASGSLSPDAENLGPPPLNEAAKLEVDYGSALTSLLPVLPCEEAKDVRLAVDAGSALTSLLSSLSNEQAKVIMLSVGRKSGPIMQTYVLRKNS